MEAPIHEFPDCSAAVGTFMLNASASEGRIGAALLQMNAENQQHAIAYAIRCLSKPGGSIPRPEKKCLDCLCFLLQTLPAG